MSETWSFFPPFFLSKGNDAAKGIWESWEELPPKAVMGHVHAVACRWGLVGAGGLRGLASCNTLAGTPSQLA
jgi:hypothetical protein